MTDDAKTTPSSRQNYETLRLAIWAVRDALSAAAHIAGRASDCFDGTELCAEFESLRREISNLQDSSDTMKRINTAMHAARKGI